MLLIVTNHVFPLNPIYSRISQGKPGVIQQNSTFITTNKSIAMNNSVNTDKPLIQPSTPSVSGISQSSISSENRIITKQTSPINRLPSKAYQGNPGVQQNTNLAITNQTLSIGIPLSRMSIAPALGVSSPSSFTISQMKTGIQPFSTFVITNKSIDIGNWFLRPSISPPSGFSQPSVLSGESVAINQAPRPTAPENQTQVLGIQSGVFTAVNDPFVNINQTQISGIQPESLYSSK